MVKMYKYPVSISILIILGVLPGATQNYVGFSKEYIKKEMKAQKKDLKGPLEMKDTASHYLAYISKDGKRAVYYHLKSEKIKLQNGKVHDDEICYKYVSVTKCLSLSSCPEMDKVVRSLDSHFERKGVDVWIDNSRKIPQQWLLVKEGENFQVQVTELAKNQK